MTIDNETMKRNLERDVKAIRFLIRELESNDYVKYTALDLLDNDDSILTGAHLLQCMGYFNNPDGVIRYFEKARHYSIEVTKASFVEHVKYLLENKVTGSKQLTDNIENWLIDYSANDAIDLDDVLEGLKSDLTLYQ